MRSERIPPTSVLSATVATFVTVCICFTCGLSWRCLRGSPAFPVLPPFQFIVNDLVTWWFFEVLAISVVACFAGILCVKRRASLLSIHLAICIVLSCLVACGTFLGLMALLIPL